MLKEISNKIIMTITKEQEKILKERIKNCLKNVEINEDIDINFEDKYPLYFGGKELKEGVFVRIEIYNRKQDRERYAKLKEQIRDVYISEFRLTKDRVFVQFDDYEQ